MTAARIFANGEVPVTVILAMCALIFWWLTEDRRNLL